MTLYDINIPADLGYNVQKRFQDETNTYSLHWHSFLEIEVFIEGSGMHEFNNQSVPIKSGDVLLLSTIDSHQVTLNRGMRNINMSLSPKVLHKTVLAQLNLTHPLHISLTQEELQDLLTKIDILFAEQEHHGILTNVKTTSIINELVIDILQKSPTDMAPPSNPLLYEMINYIKKHYKTNISISEIAKEFSLTPNYCGHLFKKTMGMSVNTYLNTLRLNHACNALLNTDLPISEIAYESGFNSLEYFHVTFKKFYGVTPAKYRSLTPR